MLHYIKTVQRIQAFANKRSEKGASAVEYGLLVAAIAAVIVAVVFVLGGLVKGGFSTTCTEMGGTSCT